MTEASLKDLKMHPSVMLVLTVQACVQNRVQTELQRSVEL